MGNKVTSCQNAFVLGEISPRCYGRFDGDRPIWKFGAGRLQNWLIMQAGGVFYRPGTYYAGEIKDSSKSVRLIPFRYSTDQSYIIEFGDQYMRFWANNGQVVDDSGDPVEISTIFTQDELALVKFANKADVMYLVRSNHIPQKLTRLSATSFQIANVEFRRGPFRDDNTSITTITANSDVGIVTLTASLDLFYSGHVGSLWRVKDGVVKITEVTGLRTAIGYVDQEPDGTPGNLGTSGEAVTDWAEGAFSDYRGWPATVTFQGQRLVYGGVPSSSQKLYASSIEAYDSFDKAAADDADSWQYEIASEMVNSVRWLIPVGNLQAGTLGGTVTIEAQAGSTGITPTTPPNVTPDTDNSVSTIDPVKLAGFIYYLTSSNYNLHQLIYSLQEYKQLASDMNVLSDHILRDGGGAVSMARQQSPNDRIWIPRADGQIAVFTRNAEQKVMGWSRIVGGESAYGPGLFEDVAILSRDGDDDIIWTVVQRKINGVTKRFMEYFTPELFSKYYEPVRVDCALTYDVPITITAMTNASPIVVTAPGHGLENEDQIKIDNVVGMMVVNESDPESKISGVNENIYYVANKTTDTFSLEDYDGNSIDGSALTNYRSGGQVRKMVTEITGLGHFEGEEVTVITDGGLPSKTPTHTVADAKITLANPAAVIHIGLPYDYSDLHMLPLGDGSMTGTGQAKTRKPYLSTIRFWNSSGGKLGWVDQYGKVSGLASFKYPKQTPNLQGYRLPGLYTGDLDLFPLSNYRKYSSLVVRPTPGLPMMVLAIIILNDLEEM